MLSRRLHIENAKSPILVTLLGMLILVRLLHWENAASSMLVTLLGIVMLARLEHPKKARRPMFVTLLGMVICVRLSHNSNALSAMTLVSFLITYLPQIDGSTFIRVFPIYRALFVQFAWLR